VKRVLVTGGCGFIGTNLIPVLLDNGIAVRVFDNLSVGSRDSLNAVCDFQEPVFDDSNLPELAEKEVQLVVGDITDAELTNKACSDIDGIVHLAANTGVGPSVEQPLFDCHQNVNGTVNCLEAARKNTVKKFIFASSGAPAGEVEPPIHENIVPKPVSPYGASKLAGEGYCSAYARTFNVETVALRFGNVYGPGSGHKSSVVAKFINRALDGLPIEIYGDGSQTRDFIYIADLIEAIMLSLKKPDIGGEVFQIATSAETTVNEITDMLCQVMSEQSIKVPEIIFSEPRLGDVKRNFSDTSKAAKYLGWKAKFDLEAGLKNTLHDLISGRDNVA